MPDIPLLQRCFGRAGAVDFSDSPLGGGVATLKAADGAVAVVALTGGQVLSYVAPGHGEVLWLSPMARLDSGRAVRGGIPICWPWFGAHPSDTARPAHGVARTASWRVLDTSGAAPRIVLGLDARDATGAAELSAQLEVTLDDGLRIAIATSNRGAVTARLTAALHSYFQISEIEEISVGGLEGRLYIDQLDGGRIKSGAEPVRFTGELDRIYQQSEDSVSINDPGMKRRIVIDKSGSQSTVVWNPWSAKAERLGDLGPDGFRRMVCVETANAGDDVVRLEPGATHVLAATLRVRSLGEV